LAASHLREEQSRIRRKQPGHSGHFDVFLLEKEMQAAMAEAFPMLRHLRDSVQDPVSLDYFQERASAGWKLKAIEWEREVEAPSETAVPPDHPAPYGLEIAPDASRLRQNPHEIDILMTVLELIVVEKGVSYIAEELNLRGFKTRQGNLWTSPAVFNLLPRLIELGPDILKSNDWQTRRGHLHAPPA
jgi:hypothetical protein